MIKEKVSQGRKAELRIRNHALLSQRIIIVSKKSYVFFIQLDTITISSEQSSTWLLLRCCDRIRIPLRSLRFKVARNRSQIDHSAFAYFCVERETKYPTRKKSTQFVIHNSWRVETKAREKCLHGAQPKICFQFVIGWVWGMTWVFDLSVRNCFVIDVGFDSSTLDLIWGKTFPFSSLSTSAAFTSRTALSSRPDVNSEIWLESK